MTEGNATISNEIERKYRIDVDPSELGAFLGALGSLSVHATEIEQHYLGIGGDGTEERVRSRKNLNTGNVVYTRTIKEDVEGSDGLVRTETEREIDAEEFESFVCNNGYFGIPVVKTRHEVPVPNDGPTLEVDVYDPEDALAGLLVVEAEFPSEEEANAFNIDVALEALFTGVGLTATDVTADKRYKNKNLALDGLPDEE